MWVFENNDQTHQLFQWLTSASYPGDPGGLASSYVIWSVMARVQLVKLGVIQGLFRSVLKYHHAIAITIKKWGILKDKDTTSVYTTEGLAVETIGPIHSVESFKQECAAVPRCGLVGVSALLTTISDSESREITSTRSVDSSCIVVSFSCQYSRCISQSVGICRTIATLEVPVEVLKVLLVLAGISEEVCRRVNAPVLGPVRAGESLSWVLVQRENSLYMSCAKEREPS